MLSDWISKLLNPLAVSELQVKNSAQFARDVRSVLVEPVETIVSFDVVGLFPSIPIDFALETIRDLVTADTTFGNRCPISHARFLSLLEFLLRSTVFKFEGKFYEQVSGVPMGSPCSVVVSNIVMQRVEREAMSSSDIQVKFYRRFIDDIFAVLRIDKVDTFRDNLNSVHQNLQVTVERAVNNSLPFLDVRVTVVDGSLHTSVYRKPTHTGRYLAFDSAHPVAHKQSVVFTLVKRARDICSSQSDLMQEFSQIRSDLTKNGYPARLINKAMNDTGSRLLLASKNWISCAFIPFVHGLSEPLSRTLANVGVKTRHIPVSSVRQMLHQTRPPCDTSDSFCVVYDIPCRDCSCSYVGQTSRFLKTRLKEHKDDKTAKSALTEHMRDTGHHPLFDQTKIIARKVRYHDRIWAEAWSIASRELKGSALSNRSSGSVSIPDTYKHFLV
jgi:hypothetical protein